MRKKYSALATVGTWKQPNGRTAKRTVEIGAIFESSKGNLVLKLDAVPVSAEWSGWVALHPVADSLPPGVRVPPGFPPAPDDTPGSGSKA